MRPFSRGPYLFDEFFASGKEESISPFLTPGSRKWGRNLSLKNSAFSALLLIAAFGLSFHFTSLSYFFLAGVYFLAGTPALIDSIEDLKNLEINIDVLMTLAALLSVVIGSPLEGALLLVLFELSASLEQMVLQKTKSALLHLKQITPKMAWVLDEAGRIFQKNTQEIVPGTHILIKAGEVVPLDGLVIEGASFVNLVHLTGESEPVSKKQHDEVASGALNLEGTLVLKVIRNTYDSTLGRIVQLITQAQEAKPQLERFLDRFGKWYAITIMLLAGCFALILPVILSLPFFGEEGSIYRSLTFLIAASPCALILATPTAYLSALSSAAKKGILLKGAGILDGIARAKTIAFDKTGTLTTGKLKCIEIHPLLATSLSKEKALAIASGLEQHAVHPIGHAILELAHKQKIVPDKILHFNSKPGYGLEGTVELDHAQIEVCIGNPDFIQLKLPPQLKEHWHTVQKKISEIKSLNTLLLAANQLFAFEFHDEVRESAAETLPRLKQQGLHLVMLTGDHTAHALTVAKELGIDEIYANLRPEDKLDKVALFSKKQGLIMVGDGVNDAPALARASVGMSLGKLASATAVDASDVILLYEDLSLIPWLTHKATKTMRIIKQNLILALAVILFATTPALLGWVPLWIAVVLHEGGTLLVGFNSLRLLR